MMVLFKQRILFCWDKLRRSLANFVTEYGKKLIGYSKDQLQIMLTTYSLYQFRKVSSKKRVICVWKDGGSDATGLADRIKGMVSSYIIADIYGYDFYTYHNQGFLMQDYLEPNEVDWRIELSEVSMGLNRFKILWYLDHLPALDPSVKEYHPHRTGDITGALPPELAEKYSFFNVFRKLFKPSERLRMLVDKAMKSANLTPNNFVAVHVRFLDFFENVETLREGAFTIRGSQEEQREMLDSVQRTIRIIRDMVGVNRVLLLSDSITFLSQSFPDYVCTLSGKLGHIQVHGHTQEVVDKTFTDMFVMAEAREIINIHGPGIYSSDYCRIASVIGNKPFKRITRL